MRIYPRERTRRKVEREGEPKQRMMQVGDKSSVRERVESEEGRLWGLRDGEKPQVGGGRLDAGEKG